MIAVWAALALGLLRQGEGWSRLWTELETLRAGRVTAGESQLLREDLVRALESAEEGPRSDLLRASLESLAGRDSSVVASRLAALDPVPFTHRERWLLADLLPPGRERARVVLAALHAQAPLADWQVLLAWNTAVDEARALRLEASALPIQEALFQRYPAAWSAEDLARTYAQLDRGEDADRILAEAIDSQRGPDRRAHLWTLRGANRLGSGDERGACDYLGRALAEGDEDAALVLSRLDLAKGRTEAARRGFQALILDRPPPAWAWRGWGSTLLPRPHADPASRPLPTSNE